MASLRLDSPVQYVPGVGPRRAALLAEIGIHTVEDLLDHLPARYEEEPAERPIQGVRPGERVCVSGRLEDVRTRRTRSRGLVVQGLVADGTGHIRVTWFHSAYLVERLHVGQRLRLVGRVRAENGWPELINPRTEPAEHSAREPGVRPVYPATRALPSPLIRRIISNALHRASVVMEDPLEERFRRARGLLPLETAYRAVHEPRSLAEAAEGRRRLAYDELLEMQLALRLSREQRARHSRAPVLAVNEEIDRRIRARLPFALTADQERAIGEIVADMARPVPMTRLVQGDVGAGKTIVALYAALVAIARRHQVAFMAPTEVLAEQHYQTIRRFLEGSRVRCVLIRGRQSERQRKRHLSELRSGTAHLAVGTHALLEEGVEFRSLGLVVIDEQHRFGVWQRVRLRQKGAGPHYLVMTATPIPRSLAMTAFGELDVTRIEHLPPGRQPVETLYLPYARAPEAWRLVREHVSRGRQAYVVYPLVEESERLELRAATVEARRLQEEVFPDLRVGLVHGQMPSPQKQRALEAFRRGETHVLVATPVIEVGIDVPNATVMVIEHAERFGISQLHQLRGRIGRGAHRSVCVLLAEARKSEARARLDAVCRCTNGFELAEMDLRLRGPGQMLGTQQHGYPELRKADLINDFALLEQARADAARILEHDPDLSRPVAAELRRRVLVRYGRTLSLAEAG